MESGSQLESKSVYTKTVEDKKKATRFRRISYHLSKQPNATLKPDKTNPKSSLSFAFELPFCFLEVLCVSSLMNFFDMKTSNLVRRSIGQFYYEYCNGLAKLIALLSEQFKRTA